MKNRSAKIIVCVCVFAIVLIAVWEINTAKTVRQYESGASDVTSISFFMEDYRHDHGQYPSSLPELASNQVDAQIKARIGQVLSNKFNGDYTYLSLSNGFEITIEGYSYRYEPTEGGFMIIGKFGTNAVSFKSGI